MTLFAENAKDNKCICESFIEKNKRVFDLEQENAELKAHSDYVEEKLAKAKEIIKELLDFDFLPENEIKKQAEQFLSEVKE